MKNILGFVSRVLNTDRFWIMLAILLVSVGFWYDHQQDVDLAQFQRDSIYQRADATRTSCKERSDDRRVQRARITESIKTTEAIDPNLQIFKDFNTTKDEALDKLYAQLKAQAPLDPSCKERVQSVLKQLEDL